MAAEAKQSAFAALRRAGRSSAFARELLRRLGSDSPSADGAPGLDEAIDALNDPSPSVRVASLERLEQLGGEQALARIELSCSDRDAGVREAARAVMRRLGRTVATPLDELTAPDAEEAAVDPARPAGAGPRPCPRQGFASDITLTGSWMLPPRMASPEPPPPRVSRIVPVAAARPPSRIAPLVRVYSSLILPACLVLALVALVASRVDDEPAPGDRSPLRRKLEGTGGSGLLGRIASSPNLDQYVGLGVRWEGTVTELAEDRKRLTIRVGESQFAATFEEPVAQELPVGAHVRIDGIVRGRRGSVPELEGRGAPVPTQPAGQAR